MKKSILSWIGHPFIILLIIDIVLSNLWEFWKGQDSTAHIFSTMNGMVDVWIFHLTSYMRHSLLPIALVLPYILGTRFPLLRKHIWFIVIYYVMDIKDIFDYIQQGNRYTTLSDFSVFLITIFVCEAIDHITQNEKHGTFTK